MILKIVNILSSDIYSRKAIFFLIVDLIEKEVATSAEEICNV